MQKKGFDSDSQDINILLGTDQMWNFICGQIIRGQEGLVATLSKFGWLLSGPVNSLPTDTFCNPAVTHSLRVDASERTMEITGEEPLNNHVKQYFKLESPGINSEHTSVHDRFVEDIEFDSTRYVVKLPFKDDAPFLPDNYQNSLNRLKGLIKRLKGDPELFREYDDNKQQTNNQILEDSVGKSSVSPPPPCN